MEERKSKGHNEFIGDDSYNYEKEIHEDTFKKIATSAVGVRFRSILVIPVRSLFIPNRNRLINNIRTS